MKVLIVDDEELIRNVVKQYCLIENYIVEEASNGIEALEKVKQHNDIDIIILDIMMPKLDGLSAFTQIRQIRNIPTIILSARNEEFDKLAGFDLGIDDYVTKPFSPKELMARIKAVLKRNIQQSSFCYEDLTIDYLGHVVKIKDKELKLTPKEYDLLVYFSKNPNIALSRDQLLSKIWGYDFFGDDITIDTHIKTLRNNLGKYRELIITVRGMGYKFVIS